MANPTEYKTGQSRNSLQQLMRTQIRVHDFGWDAILAQPVRGFGDSLSSKVL
jgi:hypothetical protein